jgi:hypothetical protein
VSDDCSSAEHFEAIEAEIGSDSRFVLSRSEERLGFYRNFERALRMVPPEADLVALCDQDDHWYPDKLTTLRASLGDAQLVYSDARLVDVDGTVLANTVWEGRQRTHDNLTSLMLTNTITGAASLFRRRVVELALPFPQGPGWEFHDHWLGMVALASGRIAYVDRPLYDYVQHSRAVLRGLVGSGKGPGPNRPRRLRVPGRDEVRARLNRSKARYFYAYIPVKLRAQVLMARCSAELDGGKRRALRRLVIAEKSVRALLALALRHVRRIAGRGETLGAESVLISGILWRRMLAFCALSRRGERRATCDATMPPFDPESIAPRRWRKRQLRRSGRVPPASRSRTANGP